MCWPRSRSSSASRPRQASFVNARTGKPGCTRAMSRGEAAHEGVREERLEGLTHGSKVPSSNPRSIPAIPGKGASLTNNILYYRQRRRRSGRMDGSGANAAGPGGCDCDAHSRDHPQPLVWFRSGLRLAEGGQKSSIDRVSWEQAFLPEAGACRGVTYQTLIASLLHKYATRRLQEI